MYNFDDSIPSKPVNSFMDVGIHEDVKMDRWEYKVSENGNKFLALYFKNKLGEEVSHTEWEPSDPSQEILKDKVTNQVTRFKYILESLVPGKEFTFKADNFETFCSNILKILNESYEGKLVRLKVIYNNKNFTCLPRYIRSTWIETMDIPSDQSRIKILSGDKMSKTEADKVSPSADSTDVFGASDTAGTSVSYSNAVDTSTNPPF